MNTTIFDYYNNFIARIVISSYSRALRYRSRRENCGILGAELELRTEQRRYIYNSFLFTFFASFYHCGKAEKS